MKLAENLYVYEWTNYFKNKLATAFFIGEPSGR